MEGEKHKFPIQWKFKAVKQEFQRVQKNQKFQRGGGVKMILEFGGHGQSILEFLQARWGSNVHATRGRVWIFSGITLYMSQSTLCQLLTDCRLRCQLCVDLLSTKYG